MKILFTLFISLSLFLPLPGNKISLKDAIKKGLIINSETLDLAIQEKIDILSKDIAEKKKLFKVELSGSYLFRSDLMEINFPDTLISPTLTIPGKSIEAGAYHNFDLNLSIMQPIYSGGIISNNIRLKKNDILITKNNSKLSNLQISGKIKNSYFRYLILKEEISILNVLLDEMNLHKQKLENLFKEDLIGKSGILETEIKIDEIKLNREEIKRYLINEEREFKFLCKTDLNNIETYSECIPDFKNALLYYKKRHPVIKIIDAENSSLDIKKNISNGFYLPQINGFMELHYGKPGIDFFKNSWSPYIQTGISISYKVFNWNRQKKEIRILDFIKQKLENKRSDFIRIVKKNLHILFNTKTHLENNLSRLKKIIKTSEKIKEIKKKLFLEKQVSNLEYLTIIQKTKKYQILENKTRYNLELIKTKINTLIGKI